MGKRDDLLAFLRLLRGLVHRYRVRSRIITCYQPSYILAYGQTVAH